MINLECDLRVRAPVKATEDPEKVIESIHNIFPGLEVEVSEDHIKGWGNIRGLCELKEAFENRKIRSTARKILYENLEGSKTRFYINKQAALVGKVNILEEDISPLGDILVEVSSDSIRDVIDWLAPLPGV